MSGGKHNPRWNADARRKEYSPAHVVNAIDAAIAIFDEGLAVRFVNRRARAFLEELDGAGVGARLAEVAREAMADSAEPMLRREFALYPSGNQPMWIGCNATPLITANPGGGKRRDVLIMFQDCTRRQRLKEERDRLLEMAAIADVLPAILHELKNPLAAVTTAVEVLLEEVSDSHVADELHSILSEVRRMKLNLESVGLAHYELHATRTHVVDEGVRQTWSILAPQMQNKKLHGELDMPMLPLLPLDPVAVRAILFNLVSNAIQACQPGDRVRVAVGLSGRERDSLRLTVSDTGPGMPAEVLAKCRQLFFTTKPKGSGIGLALCERVIQGAHGEMEIDSAPGKGTSVLVIIPLAGYLAKQAAATSSASAQNCAAPAAKG